MAQASKLAENRFVDDSAPLSATKVHANRRNAAKSTGPRTLAGKRICASNATRHAILSVSPVVAGVESAADWEAHRDATLTSLAPGGYVETLLAERVAGLAWRLGRVTRYETENTAERAARAAEDVYMANLAGVFAEEMAWRSEAIEALGTLATTDEDGHVAPSVAAKVLSAVAVRADAETNDVERADWTKRLVIQAVGTILANADDDAWKRRGPEEALRDMAEQESADVRDAGRKRATIEADLRRSVRARLLLPANGLEKVARYEAHLERGLYKALHELQRMQATRAGADVVPRALDVAVSVEAADERPARRVAPFRSP